MLYIFIHVLHSGFQPLPFVSSHFLAENSVFLLPQQCFCQLTNAKRFLSISPKIESEIHFFNFLHLLGRCSSAAFTIAFLSSFHTTSTLPILEALHVVQSSVHLLEQLHFKCPIWSWAWLLSLQLKMQGNTHQLMVAVQVCSSVHPGVQD